MILSKYVARVMHPRPVSVIVSMSRTGEINGCSVSWFMPVNVDPFIFSVSLSPERLTYSYIKETGEVTLNIMPFKFVEKVHRAGSVSGRELKNKLVELGFELENSSVVRVPHIRGAPAYVEGILINELPFKDHSLMVFKGLKVYVDKRYFKENVFTEDAEVLLHVGGNVYAKPSNYVRVE
ncbi:MAG: flavin reductase family protein [Desulfurococcaceae archaeon TW002]